MATCPVVTIFTATFLNRPSKLTGCTTSTVFAEADKLLTGFPALSRNSTGTVLLMVSTAPEIFNSTRAWFTASTADCAPESTIVSGSRRTAPLRYPRGSSPLTT